jgi:hypothetical protein
MEIEREEGSETANATQEESKRLQYSDELIKVNLAPASA